MLLSGTPRGLAAARPLSLRQQGTITHVPICAAKSTDGQGKIFDSMSNFNAALQDGASSFFKLANRIQSPCISSAMQPKPPKRPGKGELVRLLLLSLPLLTPPPHHRSLLEGVSTACTAPATLSAPF